MRKVTFQSIGEIQGSQVWRNQETGVEIVKAKGSKVYSIHTPHQSLSVGSFSHQSTTLADARAKAVKVAEAYRITIARAYLVAHAEDKARRKAALAAATGEPALSARVVSAEDDVPRPHTGIIYMVTFDRIGRTGRTQPPAPLMVSIPAEKVGKAADLITVEVARYARRFLNSRWFEVDVYLEDGLVEIEAGRFGRGKITTR